jgi:hypothetical protein
MKKSKAESMQPLLQSSFRPEGLDGVRHIGFYHPSRNGRQEPVSFAMDEFRKGRGRALDRWLTLVPHMVGGIGDHDIIIRSLYCDETEVCAASPLDRLCDAIAEQTGFSYSPTRLRKIRTTHPLQGLGGHAAHRRELNDVFQFDGAGLATSARILIVDDVMVTGATLEAIATAIRSSLPSAHITAMVLGCAGGLHNEHLEPGFFDLTLDAEPPVAAAFTALKGRGRRSPRPVVPPVQAARQDQHAMQMSRSGLRTFLMYGAAVAVVALLMATLDPLHANKQVSMPALAITDEPAAHAVQPPAGTPSVASLPVVQEEMHRNTNPARVVVPQVGLREGHSFDARLITRAAAKAGETVEIVRRHVADHGPDWYLIRTNSGKTGWVMASVVTRAMKH